MVSSLIKNGRQTRKNWPTWLLTIVVMIIMAKFQSLYIPPFLNYYMCMYNNMLFFYITIGCLVSWIGIRPDRVTAFVLYNLIHGVYVYFTYPSCCEIMKLYTSWCVRILSIASIHHSPLFLLQCLYTTAGIWWLRVRWWLLYRTNVLNLLPFMFHRIHITILNSSFSLSLSRVLTIWCVAPVCFSEIRFYYFSLALLIFILVPPTVSIIREVKRNPYCTTAFMTRWMRVYKGLWWIELLLLNSFGTFLTWNGAATLSFRCYLWLLQEKSPSQQHGHQMRKERRRAYARWWWYLFCLSIHTPLFEDVSVNCSLGRLNNEGSKTYQEA